MLIRLRSRDGLERIQVPDDTTVDALRKHISATLQVPMDDITLSRNQALLTCREEAARAQYRDLAPAGASLRHLGLQHGDLVYMHYPFERTVEPVARASEKRFGSKMTVEELIAKQTRIERQETPHCASVSFERHAANAFQRYVAGALNFSIKRGGLLYGSMGEGGHVRVDAIYEPAQEGSADSLRLERGTEQETRADFIAERLGLQKVGWIFTQSTKARDFIISGEEAAQMAAVQADMGETAVTAVVSLAPSEDGGSEAHFEAFQVSDQAVRLWQEGWFQEQAEPSGVLPLRNPKEPGAKAPVIVAGKDVAEVDTDYLLLPVSIRDHEGPLGASFPIENRLLPQGKAELRQHLQRAAGKPYAARLADFHLLLYLAQQPGLEAASDLAVLVDAVHAGAAVPEGYQLIIDSLAEL
ncbi:hypothetical protein WJX81_008221 [Elliptochloris bilobata]|uniref:NPL4-like protein n=1 Tax=Elliptochloris bilobata TaxID=381761 RepID=A0AAW1QY95_9CHLO